MKDYLIDTNIFLEILLGQDKKESCKSFIVNNFGRLHLSDFSLHSIGVILFRNKKEIVFQQFVSDILPEVNVVALQKNKYSDISKLSKRYQLDFDDAYQVSIAIELDLEILTMDKDFKRVDKTCRVSFL